MNLILEVVLKVRTGIKVRAADDNKSVQHIAVHSPFLLFMRLAVSKSVLVLDSFYGVAKLCLLLTHHTNGSYDMVVLDGAVSVRGCGDSPGSMKRRDRNYRFNKVIE